MGVDRDQRKFRAIVLAGDRGPSDPLIGASEVSCKAMVPVDGVPMLERVITTLRDSGLIDTITLSGPQREQIPSDSALARVIDSGVVTWTAPAATPSTSAGQALTATGRDRPALVTTADHPLLAVEAVDYFCEHSGNGDADLVVGLARWNQVRDEFPGIRKTLLRFRDDQYCGCNLFAFMTAESHRITDVWRRVESDRKHPLRIIRLLGAWSVIRYLAGRLSLDQALAALSHRVGIRIGAVILPWADAAVDVDTLDDRDRAERRITARRS